MASEAIRVNCATLVERGRCTAIIEVDRDSGEQRVCGKLAEQIQFRGTKDPVCIDCMDELMIDGAADLEDFEYQPGSQTELVGW